MIWTIINTLATVISMIAFVLSALYVRAQLKSLDKDRYLSVTNQLFALWQSQDFMETQLWLLHRMEETTWEGFVQKHRGDYGEMAFHRVGSFYDRVGTMVRLGIVNEREILSTMGAYAIAVWNKIEPLVREARRLENSVLFDDFERLLPGCYECYVPSLSKDDGHPAIEPFALIQPTRRPAAPMPASIPTPTSGKAAPATGPDRISIKELRALQRRGAPLTLLDVRKPQQIAAAPRTLPGALVMAPDEVPQRLSELSPQREVVAYCT